eukprot:scaffold75199_cov36-Tisochrysis_lutea.AAC.1
MRKQFTGVALPPHLGLGFRRVCKGSSTPASQSSKSNGEIQPDELIMGATDICSAKPRARPMPLG